jgi:hypothetical protein
MLNKALLNEELKKLLREKYPALFEELSQDEPCNYPCKEILSYLTNKFPQIYSFGTTHYFNN